MPERKKCVPLEVRQPVGLIGFNNRIQVDSIIQHIPEGFDPQIMIGVSVEYIGNEFDTNVTVHDFSVTTDLKNIFARGDKCHPLGGPLVENFIYFRSRRREDLLRQLRCVVQMTDGNTDALFLNLIWPSTDALEQFRKEYPNILLFLKISAEAYARIGAKPKDLDRYLDDYRGLIDRVVLNPFDDSQNGLSEPSALERIIQTLGNSNKFELAIAGRIGQNNLPMFHELICRYPGIGVFMYRSLLDDEGNFELKRAIHLLDNKTCCVTSLYQKT